MVKILHCSDIHLTAGEDKDYSFSVLKEIVSIACREKTEVLVFAGDTFDSYEDAKILAGDFKNAVAELKDCSILVLPGNHDCRTGDGSFNGDLSKLDLGGVKVAVNKPFEIIELKGIEFLCIPHNNDYTELLNSVIPEKRAVFRLVVAHSVVSEMVYTGNTKQDEYLDEEAGTAVISQHIFVKSSADYVLMGHIHNGRLATASGIRIVYPGSARVWRISKYETGKKQIVIYSADKDVSGKWYTIISAGQLYIFSCSINIDGTIPESFIQEINLTGEFDILSISFFGIVENIGRAKDNIDNFCNELKRKVRTIKTDYTGLEEISGIQNINSIKQFLSVWEEHIKNNPPANEFERNIQLKAKEEGIKAIMGVLDVK